MKNLNNIERGPDNHQQFLNVWGVEGYGDSLKFFLLSQSGRHKLMPEITFFLIWLTYF